MAPTPEQKQEILRLFKLESEPIVENQYEYIIKAVQGLLAEDKFSSFLNIRKGKVTITTLILFNFLLMRVVDVSFEVIAIPTTGCVFLSNSRSMEQSFIEPSNYRAS